MRGSGMSSPVHSSISSGTSTPLRSGPSTPLRSGFTTGACAAAAAKGAALMLVHQISVREVTLTLPAGVSATFLLHGQTFSPDAAACFVVKDAGDDPDVTNGAEVHAEVRRNPPSPPFKKGGVLLSSPAAPVSARSPSRDWRSHPATGPSIRFRAT